MSERGEILVVEDDLAIRRLVKMVLRREGYGVDEASDGVEAVKQVAAKEYDVIILDLMMPHLDGFSFIAKVASHDPSRLKKIIITSAASPSVIEQRMRGIAYELLPKPFDIHDLAKRVRDCILAQTE